MYINAGELDKRIQIIQISREADWDGYSTAQETVFHSCWARFTRTSGTEMVKADADFGEVKVRFLIRYTRKPIDRKMLVRYNKTDYEIEYINDYGDQHQYIEIWGVWRSKERK